MTERTIHVPHPPRLPADHLQRPERSILSACGDAVLSYCRETHTGSVFRLGTGVWLLAGPIGLGGFLASVESMGIQIADDAGLHHWLDCVSGNDAAAELIDRAGRH